MSDEPQRFPADNPYVAPRATDAIEPPATLTDDGLPLRPWRTMWTAPRQTIRRIVSRDPRLHVVTLLCLNGIGQSLGRASQRNAGDVMALPAILGTALVGGALGGCLGGWIVSHVLRITGRWIGGSAERSHLLAAFAWSAVPTVVGLTIWIPQFAVAGTDLFTSATPRLDASPVASMVMVVTGILGIALAVWSFVLACNTVAEVQGFRSAWAGFGNLVLSFVFVAAVVLAIVALVAGMGWLMRR